MNKPVEAPTTRPFPWKCGQCRQREVFPWQGQYNTEVVHDGRAYVVTLSNLCAPRCRACGALVLDSAANRQISQAFRRQAQLLTPEEIREQRKALGLTQEQLAAVLSFAEATLSRWETGAQIQQRSLDKLLRLFFALPEVRHFLEPPKAALPAEESAGLLPAVAEVGRPAGTGDK